MGRLVLYVCTLANALMLTLAFVMSYSGTPYESGITGNVVGVPASSVTSLSAAAMGLVSLLIAKRELSSKLNSGLGKDDEVIKFVREGRKLSELKGLFADAGTDELVETMMKIFALGLVSKDSRKMLVIKDVKELVQARLSVEKDVNVLNNCSRSLGRAVDLCEKAKVPGEVKATINSLYAMSKYFLLNKYKQSVSWKTSSQQ